MTFEQIIGLLLAWLVMFIGLLGSILPALPSTPVVLAAALIHRLWFGADGPETWVLLVMGGITALSLLLDYLASMYGAKRFGASKYGIIGAAVGGLVGLFFSLPGILFGPFIGALAFEAIAGRDFKESSRAGVGATIGLLGGVVGKVACCVAMGALFSINVIYRSIY